MRVILGMLSGLALSMGPLVILMLNNGTENEGTAIFGSHLFGIMAVGVAIIIVGLPLYRWRSKLPKFGLGLGLGTIFGLIHFLVFSVQQFTLA